MKCFVCALIKVSTIPSVPKLSSHFCVEVYSEFVEHVLEDIRYYLKQTDYSIKQICDLLGFPNPSFFSRYVKIHFGQTPAYFRQH